MLASVERVLSRFGADKTISAEPALHVINSVACRQIALALLDTMTDPGRLSQALRFLILNEQTEAEAESKDASTTGTFTFKWKTLKMTMTTIFSQR